MVGTASPGTARLGLEPQSAGLYALSLGLSENFKDAHEMLSHGTVMYDALYAWRKSCQDGTHVWLIKVQSVLQRQPSWQTIEA